MKVKGLLVIVLILVFDAKAQENLRKFEWLLGSWSRTNTKPGRSGIEIWKKVSDTEFIGKGINLKGIDTSFVEKLTIISRGNKIFYVAHVPENEEPVYFEATALSKNSVTFENRKHDFPKKIDYEFIGSKLKATISGDGKSIDYWFEKK